MRKIAFVLLFLVLISVPTLAFSPRDSYLDTIVAIAWTEGGVLHVGLGNTSNSRTTVTISTTTVDSWGRPVFSNRQVNVPGRTIIQESIRPNIPGRNEELKSIRIAEGYRTITIPVQNSELLKTRNFIIEANKDIEVTMDLGFLLQSTKNSRLIIDDFYQTADGNRGPVKVSTFEGGLRYVRSSNSIEFAQPYMVLTMKSPQTNNLTTMTFSLRKTEDGYGWRDEVIDGPIFLVYGRNFRFSGSSSSTNSGNSNRVPR